MFDYQIFIKYSVRLAKLRHVKDKRQINALFHKSSTHPLSPSGFLQENATAKVMIIFETKASFFNKIQINLFLDALQHKNTSFPKRK